MTLKTERTKTRRNPINQTFALFAPDNLFDSLIPFAHLTKTRQDRGEKREHKRQGKDTAKGRQKQDKDQTQRQKTKDKYRNTPRG